MEPCLILCVLSSIFIYFFITMFNLAYIVYNLAYIVYN